MKSCSLSRLAALFALGTFATVAFADGPLDLKFGDGNGISAFPIGSRDAVPYAIAQDASGRIITAGWVAGPNAIVTRHLSFGELDPSFGDKGVFTSAYTSTANGLVVDHHGRIVVAGSVSLPIGCDGDPRAVVRAHQVLRLQEADGLPDLDFGTGPRRGNVSAVVGGCYGFGASGLAIDADDNITTVGIGYDGTNYEIGMARWTSKGEFDSTFGAGGSVTTAITGTDVSRVSLTSDAMGRLWVAATGSTSTSRIGIVLRYQSNGQLDTSFGNDGVAKIPIGSNGDVCCIALDDQGRAMIAGSAGDNPNIFVARLNNAGTVDTTFGDAGTFVPPLGLTYSHGYGLALDGAGRAVVAGYSSGLPFPAPVVLQFNLDGTLNAALGFGGVYTTGFGFGASFGTSLMLDSAGRPTMAAYGYDRDGSVPALIRYDQVFGEGFD